MKERSKEKGGSSCWGNICIGKWGLSQPLLQIHVVMAFKSLMPHFATGWWLHGSLSGCSRYECKAHSCFCSGHGSCSRCLCQHPSQAPVQGGTGLCFRGFPGNPKGTSDICKRLGLRLLVLFEYPVRLTRDESHEPQEVLRKGCLTSQTSPPPARTAPLSRTLLATPQIKAETDFSAAWSLSFSIMLKYSRVCHSAVCHKQPTTVHDLSINIHVWCSNSDSFELSIRKEQIETFLNFLCSMNHSLACQSQRCNSEQYSGLNHTPVLGWATFYRLIRL